MGRPGRPRPLDTPHVGQCGRGRAGLARLAGMAASRPRRHRPPAAAPGERALLDERALRPTGDKGREPPGSRGDLRDPLPRGPVPPARAGRRTPRDPRARGRRRRRTRGGSAHGGRDHPGRPRDASARDRHLLRPQAPCGAPAPRRRRPGPRCLSVSPAVRPPQHPVPDSDGPARAGAARGAARGKAPPGRGGGPGSRVYPPPGRQPPSCRMAAAGSRRRALPPSRPRAGAPRPLGARDPAGVCLLRSGLPLDLGERRTAHRLPALERTLPPSPPALTWTRFALRRTLPGSSRPGSPPTCRRRSGSRRASVRSGARQGART